MALKKSLKKSKGVSKPYSKLLQSYESWHQIDIPGAITNNTAPLFLSVQLPYLDTNEKMAATYLRNIEAMLTLDERAVSETSSPLPLNGLLELWWGKPGVNNDGTWSDADAVCTIATPYDNGTNVANIPGTHVNGMLNVWQRLDDLIISSHLPAPFDGVRIGITAYRSYSPSYKLSMKLTYDRVLLDAKQYLEAFGCNPT